MVQDSQQDLFVTAPVWWEGLTRRRRLFVECYCTDRTCFLNASASFIKAYSKTGKDLADPTVMSNASRLLRDPKVQGAIAKLLRARQNAEDELNEFRMLEYLKTLAFYNPADIIDNYGNFKIKKDLSELGNLAVCVAGIKQTRNGKEIKLYDRTKAMDLLGRYLDIIRPADSGGIINPVMYMATKDEAALRAEAKQAMQDMQAAMDRADDAEYQVIEE